MGRPRGLAATARDHYVPSRGTLVVIANTGRWRKEQEASPPTLYRIGTTPAKVSGERGRPTTHVGVPSGQTWQPRPLRIADQGRGKGEAPDGAAHSMVTKVSKPASAEAAAKISPKKPGQPTRLPITRFSATLFSTTL